MMLTCIYILLRLTMLNNALGFDINLQKKDNSQMGTDKIEITSLLYRSSDNGSINPEDPNYHSEWSYTPSHEESEKLLDEILVNKKVTLRQYFIALGSKDTKFLEDIKLKNSSNNLNKLVKESPVPTGARSSYWVISAKLNKDNKVAVSSDSLDFKISQFPFALVRSNGIYRSSSRDGMSNRRNRPN